MIALPLAARITQTLQLWAGLFFSQHGVVIVPRETAQARQIRACCAVFTRDQFGVRHVPSNASVVDLFRDVAECYGHRPIGE